MQLKKLIYVISVVSIVYIIGSYIYLSTKPLFSDECPVTIPGKVTDPLEDAAYPGHLFKTINDASCLNQTRVFDIIKVTTIDDIRNALNTAIQHNLQVSIAGVRHSMGGQAFSKDALVLDMRNFNKILFLDENQKIVTVQSGATWHDIQLYLHDKNLSVKAMQSTDIFTVGGSLSVNAHGMDHNVGSVASTVTSFSIMFANGNIKTVTKADDPVLFNAVIGGYGLFGIILEVSLQVTDNVMYKRDTIFLKTDEFPAFFKHAMQENKYGLLYAHLSTSPITFFKDVVVYGYAPIEHDGPFEPLGKVSLVNVRRFLINLAKIRTYAQVLKWVAEKYIDPKIDELRKQHIISRNAVMHDSVEYLQNILVDETDILHEYFIPRKHFNACIKEMATILKQSSIPVLNASVRAVHKESIMLNYAPEDMFAIVLYLNQQVTTSALSAMEKLTKDLINLVLKFNGTFFLPYQLHYSSAQLHKAYPHIDKFFALKRVYDPSLLFVNTFYATYSDVSIRTV